MSNKLFALIAFAVLMLCAINPALADVAGTLSAGTDTLIIWAQAAAALVIIVCGLMLFRGNAMIGIVGMVVGLAVILGARDLAAIIQ